MAKLVMRVTVLVALALVLALNEACPAEAWDSGHSSIQKKAFASLECGDEYDSVKFARLSAVCDKCHLLTQDPRIGSECRKGCFKSEVFAACEDALEEEQLMDKAGNGQK